ncbi:MAG TPA: hypothetical protein ACFE0H_15255 [Elainellaceae cyanobacterium]
MNVLFVRISQNKPGNTFGPFYDEFYSVLDACIVVGYCLTVFITLPVFVVLAWGLDALRGTS